MATKRTPRRRPDVTIVGPMPDGSHLAFRLEPLGLPAKTRDGERLAWVSLDEPALAFAFTERKGRWVWVGLQYLGGSRDEITGRKWRDVAAGKYADQARMALGDKVGKPLASVRKYRSPGERWEQAELEEAARLYKEALKVAPKSPLKYVQERLGRLPNGELKYPNRSTAQRRVDAARRAGLLGEQEGRRKRRRPRR